MAKKYFELLLSEHPELAHRKPIMGIVASLRIATKVHIALHQFN
jgi:hypothetical protein